MGLLGLLKRPLRSRCRIGIYSVAEYRLRIFGLDMEIYRKVLIRIMRMRDSRRLRVFILLIWWLCKNLSPSFFPPSQFFLIPTHSPIHRQWFNLLALRTRRFSIFQHSPDFNKQTQNLYIFPAILFALVMAIFWLDIPQLQSVLGTSTVPAEHFFLFAAFGVGILLLDEGRKWGVRRWKGGWLARIAW